MIRKVGLVLFALLFAGSTLTGARAETTQSEELLAWKQLPALPDELGVAGAFAGASGGAIIAGGGANFPDGMPWENGTKVWHDAAYVLPEGETAWKSGLKLPRPLGYGVSVTADDQVICVGGCDSTSHYTDAFALKWNGSSIEVKELPDLPAPVAYAGGAVIGDTVYVVGGSDNTSATSALASLYALNLKDLEAGWKTLDPIPGGGRILPAVAALENALYVFSGASLAADASGKPQRTYLKDSWRYTPDGGWKKLSEMPRPAVAAPVVVPDVAGNSSLFVVGGDDGSLVGFEPAEKHPGFPGNQLTYNAVTNTWADRGAGPVSVVTAPVVPWKDGAVIVSGEVRPGVRSAQVHHITMPPYQSAFGFLNYLTLGLYLAMVLGIGFWCSRGNNTTEDYFRGGQSIPWWGAGISIFATTLSSITFMAVPAKAFSENWVFMLANLPILLIAPFIVFVIMPVFRRMDVTSAYEYLERRFNLALRLFGSAAFVLFQLGRMAIVMFLPALALATVTNIDVIPCVLLMGVLTVVYCVFGGITADIWTDFVQTIVFMGGALLSVVYILMKTDGGLTGMVDLAMAENKLKMVNWTWDATTAALWVVLIGNIFDKMISYTSDQTAIQRYMTTADEKKAAQSIWLNAIVAMPATVMFFIVGTALYVYYVQHPNRLIPGVKNDAIFPLFIARELPAGLAGILVASIFAAAQSTISTSMNSMSTVVVTDWWLRLRRTPPTERQNIILARSLTAVFGIAGTACAVLLAVSDIKSLWDLFVQLLGLTGGALTGLFFLGIFTRRANGTGAAVGAVVSVVTVYIVQKHTDLHFFLYGMTGIVSCFVVGYLASLVSPALAPERLRGLTIHSIKEHNRTASPADPVPQN